MGFIMERSEYETTDFCISSESDSHPLLEEKVEGDTLEKRRASSLNGFSLLYIGRGLLILLLISLATNVFLLVYMMIHRNQATLGPSAYGLHPSVILQAEPTKTPAGLSNNHVITFEWATDYATDNLTLAAELWDNIDFDSGFVALPYEWTESKDLPRAQAFPWDRSKGLYVLNGYHALHCLVIRTFRLCKNPLR